jgi:hypothetical protein
LTAAYAILFAVASTAITAGNAEHIPGTIAAASSDSLTVKTREGATVRIALSRKLRISGLTRIDLAKVKQGSYIGTAAEPQADGTLAAQEVLVFPPKMCGVGEGHRPWDLSPSSTMTNANVDLVVDSVKGRVMTLGYKGGSQKVVIPPDTPIVTIVHTGRDKLVPGAHIFAVAARSDGGVYMPRRIAVGLKGLVPPM